MQLQLDGSVLIHWIQTLDVMEKHQLFMAMCDLSALILQK